MGKILHVITGLRLGGAEGVLARLVCTTQPQFEHVVVALRGEDHFGPILQAAGIRLYALDIGKRRGVLGGMLALVRIIFREQPTIVQTWLYHGDVMGGLAARLAGVRTVIWGVRNTNLDADAISPATRRVAWVAARLSGFVPDAIVCNSIVSRNEHIRFGYRPQHFRLIANGYDLERYMPDSILRERTRVQLGIASEVTLVGSVARWDPQKDHANLFAAMRELVAKRPRVRILLVGTGMDGKNASLEGLIRNTGLTERVILTGPRNDIPAIMNAIDLHVLSSLGEAFPNVVAEAMACGTPCVVTDVGDAAQIVGDAGWVAPPRDSNALAATIDSALSSLELQGRETIAKRCRERIVGNFALRQMTDSYVALWDELGCHAT